MNKLLICFLALMIGCAHAFAQAKKDSIQVHKKGLGYHYLVDGKKLTAKQISRLLGSDPESKKIYQSARSTGFFATLLGACGGGLIGGQLGGALAGAQINPAIIIAGAGVLAVGCYVAISSDKKMAKAVKQYNTDIGKTSFRRFKPEYYLSFHGTGVGLTVRF